MAASAFQTKYRQEYIAGFEQRESLLRQSCTTEIDVNGNVAVFLVADSGAASAVTRGLDGMIPPRNDSQTQNSCTLAEWHDLPRKTGFNIYASQANQREMMQRTSYGVVNRKIDKDILAGLLSGSVTWGSATTASLAAVMVAITKLQNAGVPNDSNIYAVISPAFNAYLMQTKEFASVEYVNGKPMGANDAAWRDRPISYRWLGVEWCVHPNITGLATTSERCFMYHKSAIGHAFDKDRLQTPVGYNEEQDYSWARTSGFFGSVLLQNTGVIEMTHDGSAFA